MAKTVPPPVPNPADLNRFTEAELKAELKRRADERFAAAQQQRVAHTAAAVRHVDALLELVPEHSYSSCSDENSCNDGEGRCTRCMLLEAKKYGTWDQDVRLQIHTTHAPVKHEMEGRE